MKKLILFLAFLLPLGLMAKLDQAKIYQATKTFWMEVSKPKVLHEHKRIPNETVLMCCQKGFTPKTMDFFIDNVRHETSEKVFQSHIDNGDLKEVEKPAPKPKTVQGPILH